MLQLAMKTVRCACVIHVSTAYGYENRQSPENMQQLAMRTVRHACLMNVVAIYSYENRQSQEYT